MKPRATYRLQLSAQFSFADAASALPYLAELGISHLYLSPVLQAAPGSTHGYDVVDPDHVSKQLGGEAGFTKLVEAAHKANLGILLDIVPNHMSIAGAANRWWMDVLENGPASYYAPFFDIDWGLGMDDRVLLPILGERYGRALTSGTLKIAWEHDQFRVYAHDNALPLSPRSLGTLVRRAGDRVSHPELQYVGDALSGLPSSRDTDPGQRERRHRDKTVLLARVDALCRQEPRCREAVAAEITSLNTDAVELDALLEHQNYRLAHWSVATSQLSYRRFFDIATLVGIRNEDPDVLRASHRRVFQWLREGVIDGVRVDHVDGLRDPAGYLQALRDVAPDAWIVVEKILGAEEQLPEWQVDGTTGYEFAERMSSLLVDPGSESALTRTFSEYTGDTFDPATESRRARLEVMGDALHSELARLTELACRACAVSPACRDYTSTEVESALAEIFAGYPTYRTYLGSAQPKEPDRGRIATAVAAAKRARPELDADLLDYLESALAFELTSASALELARTAQQMTGPIVAKGDEDTLLYRQVRLLSRCDVGAELATYAATPDEIHRQLAAGKPRSLLATSTHDTKRSEDVRARIAAISEIPAQWGEAVVRWRESAGSFWGDVAPDRGFEYQAWQTLVGAWPLPLDRAQKWAEKATREARLRTSWRRPDAAYEAARTTWLERVYGDAALLEEVARIAALVQPLGDRNSLAQLLVKLTAPGVPDLYQGSELRDDSLVDPDNRRPIDLSRRRARQRELVEPPSDLDHAKLWTIQRVLELRRAQPTRFDGTYQPLAATGPHAHRVFAFVRKSGDRTAITIVPRLSGGADGWRETTLAIPPGTWKNVLTTDKQQGGKLVLAEIWRRFPTALLVDI
ncbi:MAG: malto-oligosyltrehalose synthase [Myxococcota bacterium]|nr:malto-oligosyltrehalose synthase [Myxococcota bacterium]